MIDDYTRECLAAEVDTSLPGLRVARVLDRLGAERGLPELIVVDNGPEFAGRAMDTWAYEHGTGCACTSLIRASRCRTPTARASTGAFGTSVSTNTGSRACPQLAALWRHGGTTTMPSVPTALWVIERPESSHTREVGLRPLDSRPPWT